jgi:dipeptidase E
MHIVALSSGILLGNPGDDFLRTYIFGLRPAQRSKVLFVPTASAESAESIVTFYRAFPSDSYQPSHLNLFARTVKDLRSLVLAQDVIVVPGGNTANLLAIWRLHGLDAIMREAWEEGIVLTGWSAGALCWFESGTTDSFGPDLSGLDTCLGFLVGSFSPHYNSEPRRRPVYHGLVRDGALGDGWALDDGAALHYEGTKLHRIIAGRPGSMAYRVEREGQGVKETPEQPEALWA